MSLTHTPGPWVLQDSCSWRRIGTAGPLGHDGNVLRPFVARDGHPDLVVSQADAALICAAPDLLTALREIRVELWSMADGSLRDTPAEAWLRDAGRRADAAIAKAEGR